MPARVQILVEAQDAASGIFRGLTSQLGSFGSIIEDVTTKNISWGNIATSVTSAVVDGVQDSIRAAQEYSEVIRDQMLLSGQSAEASSRFIQVLDDYQLSADDAKAATRALTREGLAPTVETVIELSRQYNELNTVEEKNAFVTKNLGRAGQEWLNLLAQGPDKIQDMNDSVSESLILNNQQVQNMEKVRLAQDAWNDTIQGTKIQIGLLIGSLVQYEETIDRQLESLETLDEISGKTSQNYRFLTADQEALIAQMERGHAMTELYNEQMQEHGDVIEDTSEDYKGLIGDIQRYQKEIDRYAEKNEDLMKTETALQAERADLQNQLKTLTAQGYGPASKAVQDLQGKITEVNKKIGDNKNALAENAAAHQEWAAQTVYAFATARAGADGMIDALEGEVLIEAGQALGLFDRRTAETMRNVNRAFDTLDTSNAQDTINLLKAQLQELVNTDWTINVDVNAPWTGQGPGGGGSPGGPNTPIPVQTGGSVYAGNPYTVGERGPEPFFPAVNGRILGHAESLHAMSLGGGGGTNYFYGPVSLEISADSASGLMSMR